MRGMELTKILNISLNETTSLVHETIDIVNQGWSSIVDRSHADPHDILRPHRGRIESPLHLYIILDNEVQARIFRPSPTAAKIYTSENILYQVDCVDGKCLSSGGRVWW